MSKISKTAAASMRGGPAEIKKDPFDTNEKKIRELRVQRTNHLAVNRFDFIDALFEEYDKLLERVEVAEEALYLQLQSTKSLPINIQEALNSGDGTI